MVDTFEALKLIGPAIADAWCVIDSNDRVVEFNSAFFALLPKPLARKVRELCCRDFLELDACAHGRCLRLECEAAGVLQPAEMDARVGGVPLRLIVSGSRVTLPGNTLGMLLILRNVTDEAAIQSRYQALVSETETERRALNALVEERSRTLLAANEALTRLEETLAERERESE